MPKTTLQKLAKDLEGGITAPVYYFTGDDAYRKLDFARKIKAAINPDDFNFTREDAFACDMGELVCSANTAPVFSNRRLIILNNADKIKKGSKAATALEEYLKNPLESTCFVILHNDAKKSKKDKTFEDACSDICAVCDFAPLEGAQLSLWISNKFKQHGLKADTNTIAALEELTGADLTALEAEIEKLSLYLAERADKTVAPEDVFESIGFNKEENPFALSNAVMDCDKAQSLKLIAGLLAAGEEPIGILNKISACAVKMLRIKRLAAAGLSQYEIVSAAGLLPWEGRLVARAGSYPPVKTLLKAIDKIIETDMALKSSASGGPEIMLKGVILTLFGK